MTVEKRHMEEVDFIELVIGSERIRLKKCIIGGVMDEEKFTPMGSFFGNGKLADNCIMLEFALRSFYKMLVEEMDIPRSMTEDIMKIAVMKAIDSEEQADPMDNLDLDTHKLIKELLKSIRK